MVDHFTLIIPYDDIFKGDIMQLIQVIGFNRILKVDYFYKRVIAVTVWVFYLQR